LTGAGGKKNRQKERRLMKGFNIAPAPTSTSQLPTVAEFMANLQQHHEQHVSTHHLHDIFGSTTSAIFGSSIGPGSTPKKSHHHHHANNNNSSSGGGANGDHHTHRGGFGRLPRLHIKRSSSHKRRWGTLIEAAKSGRVSRLIGRSRSEDSVCNNHNVHCSNHSHSNSPASDDITESPSDSNPSLAETVTHSSIGSSALAALRKRRKKFSTSRNMGDSGGNPVAPQVCCVIKGGKKQLQRASSVPTRASEVVTLISHRHEQTQSQQHSVELSTGQNDTLTPSTTEESVITYSTGVGGGVSLGSSSREPLLASSSMNPVNHNTLSQCSTQQQQQDLQNKSRNGSVVVLPNLPGIQPVSGHNMSAGWL
jgi:transient receptor potential cation channel subfamily C